MKIGEAQQIYREQVKEYRAQRSAIAKQLKDVRSRMEHFPGRQEEYASEAATLELTLNALDEKETEYQEYLDSAAVLRLLECHGGGPAGGRGRRVCGGCCENDGGSPPHYEGRNRTCSR